MPKSMQHSIVILKCQTLLTMQEVEFYCQFVSDPQSLARGYDLIKQYLMADPTHRFLTLKNLLHPSVPIMALVGNLYPNEIFAWAPAAEQAQTRELLIKLLANCLAGQAISPLPQDTEAGDSLACNSRVRNLLTFISRIHNVDGYQKWVQLYLWLVSTVPAHRVPFLLAAVLKNADDRVWVVCTHFFQYLMAACQNVPSQNEWLQVLYYCTKPLASLVGTDDLTLSACFVPFQGKLLEMLWSKLELQADHCVSSLSALNWSLKLLTVLYGNFDVLDLAPLNAKILELPSYCLRVSQQYLKVSSSSCRQGEIANLDEQLDEEADELVLLTAILHQMLELLETVHEHFGQAGKHSQETGSRRIMVSLLLACVLGRQQQIYYVGRSDKYMVGIEDEGERTLRNRCIQYIGDVLDNHSALEMTVCKDLCRGLIQLVGQMATATQEGLSVLSTQLSRFCDQPLQLPGVFSFYQEAFYFVLLSYGSQLFDSHEQQEMRKVLGMRLLSIPSEDPANTLVKICLIMILNSGIEPSRTPNRNVVQHLVEIGLNSLQHIGVLLAVTRGIAKCAVLQQLQLGTHVPMQLVHPLIDYLLRQESNNEDFSEDATHIILEYLLMLINAHPEINARLLAEVLGPSLQVTMLNRYMHDGLLSNMVVEILQNPYICHTTTTAYVVNALMEGVVSNERLADLLIRWIDNSKVEGVIVLSPANVLRLLSIYSGSKRDIISKLIKQWFKLVLQARERGEEMQPSTRDHLMKCLNAKPESCWLVDMLRADLLEDPKQLLISAVSQLNQESNFVSDFQNRLPFPFYLGIYHTQNFIAVLSGAQVPAANGEGPTNLYSQFVEKLIKYGQLFKGDHLRVLTSVFLLKLCRFHLDLAAKAIQLIESYGKIDSEDMQWQDDSEDGSAGEDQIMQRILGQKIINEELEKELVEVFGQAAWAAEQVQLELEQLKRQVPNIGLHC